LVLHFLQPRWALFVFELMLENVKLIPEMVNGNHIPINVVLQIGNIPVRIGRTLQLNVLKMGNRIKREKTEKPIGNEPEIRIARLLECISEPRHLLPEIDLRRWL